MLMKSHCEYCMSQAELRPYGKNGARICFNCAMKPEHKSETEKQFENQLNGCGPVAIIGEEHGPVPPTEGFKQ